jgi:hypothetical protein
MKIYKIVAVVIGAIANVAWFWKIIELIKEIRRESEEMNQKQ